jgi:O-antigen ligase
MIVFAMDVKSKPNVSAALWIPLMWLLIIGSRSVAQWIDPEAISAESDYMSGNLIDRTYFTILMVIGIFILFRRKVAWSTIVKSNALIFLFFLYCGISIFWSDFPAISFKRWNKAIGNLIIVIVILTEIDPIESIKTLFRRCMYILIPLSILFIKYYPELGIGYTPFGGKSLMGVTLGKNQLGRLCLVLGLFLIWNIATMWRDKKLSIHKMEAFVYILFAAMISWLFVRADSATSLGSFIIGIVIFLLLGLPRIKSNIQNIGIFIILTFIIILILQMLFNVSDIFISSLGRDQTLTGRSDLWEDLLNMNTPIFIGTGYDSFWLGDRLSKIWAKWWWRPNEAHNGYLEIYLELGLIGLFFLMGVFFCAYKNIKKACIFNFSYGRIRLTFLLIFLVYNFTEASIKGISLMWFIFLLIALECPRLPQFMNSQGNHPQGR